VKEDLRMKKRIRISIAICLMMVGMLCSTYGMKAYAFTADDNREAEAEDSEVLEEDLETVIPEQADETGQFSIPGNGQLVDHMTDDGTKQFLTIQTKSGGTFFLVLDYSGTTDNVYMLTMVDEADLAEFVDEKSEKELPAVVIPEKEETVSAEEKADSPSEDKGHGDQKPIFVIVLLAIGILVGCYYFKVVKPKKEEEEVEDENLEFCDNATYGNEGAEDCEEEEE